MARIPIAGFVVCPAMGFLKQLFFFAAERSYRFVWFANLSRFCWSSWRFLKSREQSRTISSVQGRLGAGPADTYSNDHGLNFFARLILENRYAFVIELGSYTADRSIRLSKLFPQTKFYALDITDDFSSERILDGITIGPNNLQNIAAIAARHRSMAGLVCAHGTLCCYPFADLGAVVPQDGRPRSRCCFLRTKHLDDRTIQAALLPKNEGFVLPSLYFIAGCGRLRSARRRWPAGARLLGPLRRGAYLHLRPL